MVDRDFVSFSPDTRLDLARTRAMGSSSTIFPVLDPERRIVGVMTKGDFLKPVPRQLILVDHNESTQMVPGADELDAVADSELANATGNRLRPRDDKEIGRGRGGFQRSGQGKGRGKEIAAIEKRGHKSSVQGWNMQ